MFTDLTNPMFHDEDAARASLEAVRWPNGASCPHCGSLSLLRMAGKAYGRQHHGAQPYLSPEVGARLPPDGSQYFDISFAVGGAISLAVATRGSSPFSLTYSSGPGGILALFFGADGTGALTGTLTETQTLTYTFSGNGALLATDVPEPATAALVGAGLLIALGRSRRT